MKKIAALSMTIAVLLTAWVIYALIPKTNPTEAQRLKVLKTEVTELFPSAKIDDIGGATQDIFHNVGRGGIVGKIKGYSQKKLAENYGGICKELINRMVEEGWTADRCLAYGAAAGFNFFKDMGGWVSTGSIWVYGKDLYASLTINFSMSVPYHEFTDEGYRGEDFCSPALGQKCNAEEAGYTVVQ